jgi:hypothetical protein
VRDKVLGKPTYLNLRLLSTALAERYQKCHKEFIKTDNLIRPNILLPIKVVFLPPAVIGEQPVTDAFAAIAQCKIPNDRDRRAYLELPVTVIFLLTICISSPEKRAYRHVGIGQKPHPGKADLSGCGKERCALSPSLRRPIRLS